jgi:anti-sigma factor RsiW
MNAASLHALVIDRHCGELSPEAALLLEHYLQQNPAARQEADRILLSLDATREAVLRHPEMSHVSPSSPEGIPSSPTAAPRERRGWLALSSLARAAVLALLASAIATAGYLAGRGGATPRTVVIEPSTPREVIAQSTPRKASPWAQYRMTFDPAGDGMQIVRVNPTADTKALR